MGAGGGSDIEGPGDNSSRDRRGGCRLDCRWSRLSPQPLLLRVTEVLWHAGTGDLCEHPLYVL